MHYRFIVTFNEYGDNDARYPRNIGNVDDAKNYVLDTLYEEGFYYEGRWGEGMADWFVIGGRWSGELSRVSWAKELTARMEAMKRKEGVEVWGAWYADLKKQKAQKKLGRVLQKMWDAEAPEEYKGIPVNRNTDKEFGYEDDAMLLTQEIYDALLKKYEGSVQSKNHADLDYDEISPEMIGTKWVVVVDYHN